MAKKQNSTSRSASKPAKKVQKQVVVAKKQPAKAVKAPKTSGKKPAKAVKAQAKKQTPVKAQKVATQKVSAVKQKIVKSKAPPKVTKKIKKAAPIKSPKKAPAVTQQQQTQATTVQKKKVLVAKPSKYGIYTPAQLIQLQDLKKQLTAKSNNDLKAILKKNNQSMTGNKDEMILKISDGKILGQIPRCTKCFGGRPKYDIQKNSYYCSGYRDDEDFVNCHTTFTFSELTRTPWTD